MARIGKKTISRRTVEALKVEKDTIFWDSELAGFGVRVHPTGRKVYIAQTRADGKAAKRVPAPHRPCFGRYSARPTSSSTPNPRASFCPWSLDTRPPRTLQGA